MRRKFLVLAGSRTEAEHFRKRHHLMACDVFYLLDSSRLWGIKPADYAGVILPGFHARRDAGPLLDRIRDLIETDRRTDWGLWHTAAVQRAEL